MGQIKYYTSSDGTKTPLKDIEFTHLSNGYAKKCRDIFNIADKEQLENAIAELKDIEEELKRRINDFSNKVGAKND